jgi:hypothetical protein
MKSNVSEKLKTLLEVLSVPTDGPPSPVERGVLLIYTPEDELIFRDRLEEYLLQLPVPFTVVDLEPLPFECLADQDLLDDAYRLEAEDASGLRQYLAEQLPRLLHRKVLQASEALPAGGVVFLKSTPSLFPWVKYADFLRELPHGFLCRVVIPFPGHEDGANLHFLNHRDGFNYLARRIA